jgi:3-isopropylmalate/(R)-2-methylmalate dehydratase large subunit
VDTPQNRPDAQFDKELTFDAGKIKPMITYGTNPGMGTAIDESIPEIKISVPKQKLHFLNHLAIWVLRPE